MVAAEITTFTVHCMLQITMNTYMPVKYIYIQHTCIYIINIYIYMYKYTYIHTHTVI